MSMETEQYSEEDLESFDDLEDVLRALESDEDLDLYSDSDYDDSPDDEEEDDIRAFMEFLGMGEAFSEDFEGDFDEEDDMDDMYDDFED